MNKRSDAAIIILIGATALLIIGGFSILAAGSSVEENANETRVVTSATGIEYVVEFNNDNDTVALTALNPDSRSHVSSFGIYVDNYQREAKTLDLSQNESWSKSWDISNSTDATRIEHQVTFSTSGESISFNFTREVDLSNSGSVPTPRITNVEVTNGTVYGNETAVLEVTVENPADQLYSSSLMVHTLETNFSRRGDAVAAPGNKSTVQVPLDEPRGSTVAGEVRLYDRNLSDAEDGFDQREFVGRAGGDTQVWNRTYEPADPHWAESGGYRYENETMEERIDDGDEEASAPVTAVLTAGIAILLTILVRRLR